jgi:hypothetical protein
MPRECRKQLFSQRKQLSYRPRAKLLEGQERKRLFSLLTNARPSEGWSVNILPARSAAVALPRNEVEAHMLFACVVEGVTGAGAGF